MSDDLITNITNGVARIRFNRPDARNAISGAMIHAMIEFCRRIEHDFSVRVVLISGSGAHFMAGADVKGFAAALALSPDELRRDFERRSEEAAPLWVTLERLPQPVVVAVRGVAAGLALSLVAGADYAIAADTASFLLAHVHLGLVADAGTTYHLPRAIGPRRAKQLAFLGDRIGAAEALAMGLVSHVVADSALDSTTETLLGRLAVSPSVSVAQAKHLMNASLGHTLAEQLAMESHAVGLCGASQDLREGVNAFIEKRKPVFQGC